MSPKRDAVIRPPEGPLQTVVEPELVRIPAGRFPMGTSGAQIELLAGLDPAAQSWRERGRFDRERPQHAINLATFAVGRYPVTVGEFRWFVQGDGYRSKRYWTKAGWAWCQAASRRAPDLWNVEAWAGDVRLPVVGVSWYEADAYGRWLSAMTGRNYRLPTEAEWEKAARGTDARIFLWGDELEPARCNSREGGLERTRPVGDGMPSGGSPYGCADMGGNASEWTGSKFRPYPYDPLDGRECVEGEEERVIRGGSWFKPLLRSRVSARGMNDPLFSEHDVGFRIARGA